MSDTMRALTVRQPWAWAISHAGKDVENRRWATKYRGPLAVHAAKPGPSAADVADIWGVLGLPGRPYMPKLPFGAVVAVARLVDVHLAGDCGGCSAWAEPGVWHWRLTDTRPLRGPVACTGHQRLWWLPAAVADAVCGQLDGEVVVHG